MWKKILAISLVLIMVLSFTACGEETGEEEEEEEEAGLPSAQEIVDAAVESWGDIRTYQFDMDMTMDMTGEAEGEAIELTMVMDSSGALDVEGRQMRMDMDMSMVAPEEDEMEMAMKMYLIGDMVYMMMDIPGVGPTWMKAEMPEGYWGQVSQVESQMELLEAAQAKVTGSEVVSGIDCYVLQLTPDMAQLWQIVMRQAELAGEAPEVTEEQIQEMFRSFSVKQWIAKNTYLLTRTEIDMVVEMTPEAVGAPEEEGEMAMDIRVVLLVHDYNQPVSIELPPEAEEAMEVPSGQ
jgi:hypothetical protein